MSGLKYLATSTFLAVSGFLSSCGTPSQWAGLQPLQQPLAVVETIAPIPSSNLEDSCECKEAPGKYDGKYDNHNVFVDYSKNKLEEVVAKSVVKIFTYQKYELYLNGKLVDSDEVSGQGTGVVIREGSGQVYVITNEHMMSSRAYKTDNSSLKLVSEMFLVADPEKEDLIININLQKLEDYIPLIPVAVNSEKDIAILTPVIFNDSRLTPLSYVLGDEVEIGNFIHVIGWYDGLYEVIFSSNIASKRVFMQDGKYSPTILIDAHLCEGMSGSAVLASRDGQLELVGIVSSKLRVHRSLSLPITVGGQEITAPQSSPGVFVSINAVKEELKVAELIMAYINNYGGLDVNLELNSE